MQAQSSMSNNTTGISLAPILTNVLQLHKYVFCRSKNLLGTERKKEKLSLAGDGSCVQ
jgi:hypothetical protein